MENRTTTRKAKLDLVEKTLETFMYRLENLYMLKYNAQYRISDEGAELALLYNDYFRSFVSGELKSKGFARLSDEGVDELLDKCRDLAQLYGLYTKNQFPQKVVTETVPQPPAQPEIKHAVWQFSKSKQKITSTIYGNKTTAKLVQIFNASCNPSQNGAPRSKTTFLANGKRGKNFYPQKFPKGSWKIQNIRDALDNTEGNKVIRTDAHQLVTVYKEVEIPNSQDTLWVADGTEDDWGYNIHDGKDAFADWQATTEGCIRVETTTIYELVAIQDAVQKTGGTVTVVVED